MLYRKKSPNEDYKISNSIVSDPGTREDLLIFLSFITLAIHHVFISRSDKCTSKIPDEQRHYLNSHRCKMMQICVVFYLINDMFNSVFSVIIIKYLQIPVAESRKSNLELCEESVLKCSFSNSVNIGISQHVLLGSLEIRSSVLFIFFYIFMQPQSIFYYKAITIYYKIWTRLTRVG